MASNRDSKIPHRKTLSANGTSDSVKVEPSKTQIASLARADLLPTRISKKTISRETKIRRSPDAKKASGSRSLPLLEGLGLCRHLSNKHKSALFDEIGGNMSEGLKELYIDELKDLYNAENQLLKALPKMAKAASSGELSRGFEEHLKQTRGHVQRLEKIFKSLGESPKGKKCKGMEGLVAEGTEVMGEDFEDGVMDAALIGAAQRVEHYEIAAYGTACAFAEVLGESEQASLLNETLEEEKETDEKLTKLAEQINSQANESGEEEREDVSDKRKARRVA
jgi:ferritin-like metal-binding protein YciE